MDDEDEDDEDDYSIDEDTTETPELMNETSDSDDENPYLEYECFFDDDTFRVKGYAYKGANDAPLQFDECGDLFFDPPGIEVLPKDADWIPWKQKSKR